MAKTQIKEQKNVPQTQDPTDPGVAYGEPVRIGLATGSRADNTLPERNAPSRHTQTVTPIANAQQPSVSPIEGVYEEKAEAKKSDKLETQAEKADERLESQQQKVADRQQESVREAADNS
jgi:hypothetical protein